MKTPIEQMMDSIAWEPTKRNEDDGMPYATHTGVFWIGCCALIFHQLNTGIRVIDERSLEALFNGAVSRLCPLCRGWIYLRPEADAFAEEHGCEIACEDCVATGAAV